MALADNLRELVSPVTSTAQPCLQILAALGDEDSRCLIDALRLESFETKVERMVAAAPQQLGAQIRALVPVLFALTESRFAVMGNLIEAHPSLPVIDLPSGYTPRGLQMARAGRTYLGLDLPVVTDAMERAMAGLAGAPGVSYHAVDATNRDSLAAAVEGISGRLLIATEGLLMYLNQQDLEEVFSAIHHLLSCHGGSWYTTDRVFPLNSDALARIILDGEEHSVTRLHAFDSSNLGMRCANNAFFADEETAKSFVRSMGFELREVSLAPYLPYELTALQDRPETWRRMRAHLAQMSLWKMTCAAADITGEDAGKQYLRERANSKVAGSVRGHALYVSLSGRLDALSAPDLLALWHEVREQHIEAVEVDLSDLTYISSAGLRVFVLIFKDLGGDGLRLHNPKTRVFEIIESSGLDELFDI